MTSDEDREESRRVIQFYLDNADKNTPFERILRSVVESADPLRELHRQCDEMDKETAAIEQENERRFAEAKRRADEAAAEL